MCSQDGDDDSSLFASEASAEESDEAEVSSGAFDSVSDVQESDGSAEDDSEASEEDDASDDVDGEPIDSDEEENLQKANRKPATTAPKVGNELKATTAKGEKRAKDERKEKTGGAENAPKVEKYKADKKSKEKTVEAEKAPKVEKLKPTVAKEIGKAMQLAEQTTQHGVVALCDANTRPLNACVYHVAAAHVLHA